MGALKKARFFIESLALRIGLLIVPILPRVVIRLLAAAAGRAAFACSGKLRRIALANLNLAFGARLPKRELRAIAARSFHTAALVMLDLLWFTRNADVRIERYVTIEPETETRIVASKIIGVTAHFGNWELISAATAALGVRHAVVFAELKNRYITPFLLKLRSAQGVEIIHKQGAIRRLLKVLRDGVAVAMLLDQNTLPGEGGIFADFFGLPVPVSNAAGLLSERTDTPVLLLFCMLRPDGTYYLYSLPELRASAFPEDAVSSITRSIVSSFETEIAKHPEQWLWMYKRWKYVAPGAERGSYPFYSKPMSD